MTRDSMGDRRVMVIAELAQILRRGYLHLADLNIALIEWLRNVIGVRGELIRSSTLNVQRSKVERLVAICQAIGAKVYISPPGSRAYIEENNVFAESDVELRYHAYTPPQYRQLYEGFLPSLSVLDLLLNEGDTSLAIIRSGRLPI